MAAFDIKGTLTKKVGPFPGIVWAGIAGVGIFLYMRSRKSSTATPSGIPGNAGALWMPGTPGATGNTGQRGATGDTGAQGVPGLAGAQPPPTPAPSAPPPRPSGGNRTHIVVHGDTLWGIAQQYLGNGARWPEIYALSHFRSGNPNLIYPGEVAVIPGAGGAGVGGPSGRPAGSRSKSLMHPAHPALTKRVVYTHFVRAVGGPGVHTKEVHRVAAQTGVHPARLLALNPFYTGKIRVA